MLRYAAAESLPAPLYDVAVDVDVHPHLAAPAKVRVANALEFRMQLRSLCFRTSEQETPRTATPSAGHKLAPCRPGQCKQSLNAHRDVLPKALQNGARARIHSAEAGPAQVSPEATWASKQHRLRWVLPEIAAGGRGDLKAQFMPDTKTDPLASASVLEGAAGLLPVSPIGWSRASSREHGMPVYEALQFHAPLCKQILSGAPSYIRVCRHGCQCRELQKTLRACPAAGAHANAC